VIQLGIGNENSLDRNVTHPGSRCLGKTRQLVTNIRRGIEQKPAFAIGADGSG
jgi:hypothetical protein